MNNHRLEYFSRSKTYLKSGTLSLTLTASVPSDFPFVNMRAAHPARLIVVLAVGLILGVACKHPGSQKLEGHWKGQRAEGVPDTAQLSANTFALGTEIIAQGNQIAIQTPAGRNPPATYVVEREDTTTLVIHTDKDGNQAETFTFNEKADVMVWKIDAQRSITFKKVQ